MVENSIRFSLENRDSIGGDEEIYEKIEAPKFVDFTSPGHYHPDDRYWFCLRVGCDQKHEEEMDSEAIYNKFVLRVMAARSPNVRLRKAIERNASKTPMRCPLSAPPKLSKPKLSSLDKAIPSLISKKTTEDEKKTVVQTPLRLKSTPLGKTKPVAAKYLSTPRNNRYPQDQTSFRSVQNHKVHNNQVPGSRTLAAKALFVHSPEHTFQAKTCVAELRTPVSRLCEGMKRLEISKKRALGCSRESCKNLNGDPSTRQFSSSKVHTKLKEPLPSQLLCSTGETKTSRSQVQSKVIKLPLLDSACNKQASTPSVVDRDDTEECEGNENGGGFVDHLHQNKTSSDEKSDGIPFMEGDDKENAAAPDANRIMNTDISHKGRQIYGILDKSGQVEKHVQTIKIKKLKSTNPKPFRLRTDERGILKEASLERKATANPPRESEIAKKLPRMQGKEIQKANPTLPTAVAPGSCKLRDLKPGGSPRGSNAMQRLEKFKKIKPPLQRYSIRPQRLATTKKDFSYLIPGQKLDTIPEVSPEVTEISQRRKPNGNSQSSSCRRQAITCNKELH